jgi:hypothetical protein
LMFFTCCRRYPCSSVLQMRHQACEGAGVRESEARTALENAFPLGSSGHSASRHRPEGGKLSRL